MELVKKLRCARMTLPVILASGELPMEELDRNPWPQLAATLVKPISSGQLLKTVREVLLAADNSRRRAAAFFPMPTRRPAPNRAGVTMGPQRMTKPTSDDMNENLAPARCVSEPCHHSTGFLQKFSRPPPNGASEVQ